MVKRRRKEKQIVQGALAILDLIAQDLIRSIW